MARSDNLVIVLSIVGAIVAAGILAEVTGDNRLAFGALVVIGVILPTILLRTGDAQLS